MVKHKCLTKVKPANTRPDRVNVVTLGKYLREERIAVGITSVAELIEMIEQMVSIPPDLVTDKQIYNLEGAVKAHFNVWELGAIACFAEALFEQNPKSRYLINPKYKRPYKVMELSAIGMGWLDPYTGELYPDLDLDPAIQDKLLGK